MNTEKFIERVENMPEGLVFDPYAGIPSEKKEKIGTYVSAEDKLYFRTIFPEQGTCTKMLALAFKSIITEAYLLGINTYDPVKIELLEQKIRARFTNGFTTKSISKTSA